VQETVDIAAPIEEVFAGITDPARSPEWSTEVIDVRDLSDRPVQEGTTWEQVVRLAGRHVHFQCRVAELRPPYEGVLQISGDHQGRISTRCEPTEAGTRVTQEIEFVPPGGMLGRLAGGLLGPAVKWELRRTMERMRETLEKEAGGAGGAGTSQ
jgi:uncharacterized protein YndB with AHSA1/START domain